MNFVPAFSVVFDNTNGVEKAVKGAVAELAKIGVEAARNTTLFKTSSSFRDAIHYVPSSELAGVVVSDKPWSYWLEYGNNQQGSKIYPKFAKALHFFIGGEEIFVKWVHSHGPLPFMENALKEVERQADNVMQKHLDGV